MLLDFFLDIQYEDIIAGKKVQASKTLDHCDLKRDDTCLEFFLTHRAVKTASVAQVRGPFYSDSVKLWKHYEKEMEPLIQTLLG